MAASRATTVTSAIGAGIGFGIAIVSFAHYFYKSYRVRSPVVPREEKKDESPSTIANTPHSSHR
jgi:hypothetical protein